MTKYAMILAVVASPVAAQSFSPPEGCTGYLTVQSKSCVVSNHMRCEMDDTGDNRRVDFGETGFEYSGRTNAESQWVESYYPNSESYEVLGPDPVKPASFSALLETGISEYDFTAVDQNGEVFRFIGVDRLTGEEVEIDGVMLKRTAYEIRLEDAEGSVSWMSRGSEFVNPEWGIFLSGTGISLVPGQDETDEDNTPVEFIFPGEPGFFSTQPPFGCGVVMSSFDLDQANVKEMQQ